VLSFLGLFEWDAPLTRFVRSLYHPVGYLPNPWLAQFSDIGDLLGKGESLTVFSLLILAVGVLLKQIAWRNAGWQSLLAHGAAGLISNTLKHVVGRSRPKFMHAGNLEFFPVGGSGWDSFPSGHATASFAVAAVLAVRFPKARWIIIGMAAAIAASRILRGAHFLTDTVGGAVLGWFVGVLVAHPWRDWRSSLASALYSMVPFLAALFAFTWTIGHRPSAFWPVPQLITCGMVLTLIGLLGHAQQVVRTADTPGWPSKGLTQALIGLGLGMTTGSFWVTGTVLSVCVAYWLGQRSSQPVVPADGPLRPYALTREAVFSLLVLLGLLATIELRGLLPVG
jgi:undecaprenyl-diphosphatase